MLKLKKKLETEKTNLLITRPEKDSIILSKCFDPKRFNLFISPLIEIKKMEYKFNKKNRYDLIIFTSKNGVFNFNFLTKKDKVVVIGDGTNAILKNRGIKNIVNVNGDLQNLKKKIRPLLRKKMAILHPTSTDLNNDLKKFLIDEGCYYYPLGCYNSEMKNSRPEVFESFFNSCKEGIITIFSRRTAKSFKNEISKMGQLQSYREKIILVLSELIKNELMGIGFKKIFITEEPNEKSMLRLINKNSQEEL